MDSIREKFRIKETPKHILASQQFETRISILRAEGKTDGLELAENEFELFLWQHDATGAFKENRFGKDLYTLFDDAQLSRDPDGKPRADTEKLRRTHLIQVNMSELDRLNSSGDHALGDAALERTFLACHDRTMEVLRSTFPEADEKDLLYHFDIYRTAGNDFTIILKDISSEDALQLREHMSRGVSIKDIRPDQDDVPLSASQMSLVESFHYLESMDGVQSEKGISDQSVAISFMREKLQTVNDFDKVRTRGDRMLEKMLIGRQQGGDSQASAKTLYEQFLKKYVGLLVIEEGEVQPPDFDEFSKRLQKLGAFDAHPLLWKKHVFERSRDEALRQLQRRSGDRQKQSEVIISSILSSLQQEQSIVGLEQVAQPNLERTSTKKLRELGEADKEAQQAFTAVLQEFGQTEGQVSLQKLRQEATLLADRPETDIERRKAETKLALEESKRDSLTGLYGRGMYFEQLESSLKKGLPQTVLSIDMAFLKFFDKEGGSKTGDVAIEAAGRILDVAKREMGKRGLKTEAYRVGGDEFSMIVESPDPQVSHDISRILQQLSQEKLHEIPPQVGAADTYHPEALQFNVGGYSIASMDQFQKELDRMGMPPFRGEPNSTEMIRYLADEVTHLADARIDSEKSLNRMAFLLGKSLEAAQVDDLSGERRKQLEVLMTYSEKSIFGAEGRLKILEWTQKIQSDELSVKDIVSQELPKFVTEELKKKGKEEVNFEKTSLERLEMDVKLTLLRRRLEEVERDMIALVKEFGDVHSKVDAQKIHIADVESQLSEVISIRQKLDTHSS
ncbi:diguanylate cyclase [Candidatus Uhrbacteria bacterium]|nr:diguanylate cyclase [Candidatus Uhrbacteria bacterium]